MTNVKKVTGGKFTWEQLWQRHGGARLMKSWAQIQKKMENKIPNRE